MNSKTMAVKIVERITDGTYFDVDSVDLYDLIISKQNEGSLSAKPRIAEKLQAQGVPSFIITIADLLAGVKDRKNLYINKKPLPHGLLKNPTNIKGGNGFVTVTVADLLNGVKDKKVTRMLLMESLTTMTTFSCQKPPCLLKSIEGNFCIT